MKHHYELQPGAWWAKTVVFDWDDETHEISGMAKKDRIDLIEYLEDGTVMSKKELAQYFGWTHHLPDDLLPYYKPFTEVLDVPPLRT